jgi:ribose transport system substrate-binding protein
LTPCAVISDITHLFTDSDASPEMVAQLQHRVPNLTICAAETTSSFSQQRGIDRSHYRIGFANLSETLPFAIDVRRGLERAVKEAGNIDLIVSDNQLNASTAIHIADELLRKGVDLMIEYQIDESIGGMLMNRFQQAHVPVIAVDIPLVGATFFGADNYQAGLLAGSGLGEWINAHWDGECQSLVVLEEPRAGSLPAARMQGQIDGLINSLSRREIPTIFRLDSSNNSDVSADEMYALLQRLPQTERIAVLCFNDEAALGALSAADEAGRTQHVAIVGQGADWRAREAIRRPGSRIIGSTGLMPEQYGARLIDTALKILRGEPVAPAIYTPCVFITADNIGQYYPLA